LSSIQLLGLKGCSSITKSSKILNSFHLKSKLWFWTLSGGMDAQLGVRALVAKETVSFLALKSPTSF
jgi:hypothetical protein